MSKLGFFSDPHVQYVSQVIDEILAGNLQIPRFQRPYIWGWDQRLELLRSIQLGIPMGSIMIWRTSVEALKTFDSFGTVRFKDSQVFGTRQYLLDGVQRLSTLVSALTPPGDSLDELDFETKYYIEEQDRAAFFDFVSNDFVSVKSNQATARHMPLHVLSNSVGLLRFQRNLSGVNADKWIAISDSLAKAFREYKIPVIPIVTDDVGLASQTFQRINSAGKQMSEKHMLHALTYSTSFDFNGALDQFRDSLDSIGWSGIDDELLLRLLKVSMELDMYKAKVDDVSRTIRSSPNLFTELKTAVSDAAHFFRTKLSMPNPDFVPYAVQVIGVVEGFRVAAKNGKTVPESSLVDWVWLTTYLEYFTGLSGDKVTRQINFIRSSVLQEKMALSEADLPPLDDISSKARFDYRSARSRAWMVLLTNIADRERTGSGTEIVRALGRTALVPGISREKFSDPDLYLSSGNRFLIMPNELEEFRRRLFNSPDGDFLAAHGIGDEVFLLEQGMIDEFVNQRTANLHELELQRVRQLWGSNESGHDNADASLEYAETVKNRFRTDLNRRGSHAYVYLKEVLAEHVRELNWSVGDIYGSGAYRLEAEVTDAELKEFDIDISSVKNSLEIDEPGHVMIELLANLEITVHIQPSFFLWDSIDRDEVEIHGQQISKDVTREMLLSFVASGVTSSNRVAEWTLETEINCDSVYEIDVGEVELDLGGDE
ncbi:MAG: DUF262 domain-containing protein [Massilia sp.]